MQRIKAGRRLLCFIIASVMLAAAGCSAETEPFGTETAVGQTAVQTHPAAETEPETVSGSVTDKEDNEPVKITFEHSDEIIISGFSWAPRVCGAGGVLLAGVETFGGIAVLRSEDGGLTWKDPVTASFYPELNCANVNFYNDGDKLYLAYRATSDSNGVRYTSLRVSVSEDGGKTWAKHSTVCEYTDNGGAGGVWEPYIIRIGGDLCCFYANDHPSVTDRQNIERRTWDGEAWIDRIIISDGKKHDSRDGMPVVCRLDGGGYICLIESTADRRKGYPFVLKALYSDDGETWSEPVTVYTPKTKRSKAAAPGVVCLPDGRLVISFQTDEDATVKGDGTSVMKFIVSDGSPAAELTEKSFTAPENIFGTPDGESSVWTGIYYENGRLFAAAGTKNGSSLKITDTGT